MTKRHAVWFSTSHRRARRACSRAAALSAALALVMQLMPPGLPLSPTSAAQAAFTSTPAPPPPPVNPAPRVQTVTTPGPTQVSGTLAADTVWSPQGSPYMVNGLTVPAGVELTMLPGTVVKMAWQKTISVAGTLLVLGNPGNHVVITSARDDTVMGDSNGDGSTTSPAPGDWYRVGTSAGGVEVIDYADVRYGGYGSACWAYGAIGAGGHAESVIANSSITDSSNAGIEVDSSATAGIYNNYIARSCYDVTASQPAALDIIGNTLDSPTGSTALFLLYPQKTRVWFNVVNGVSEAAGSAPTTRAMADVRFNQLAQVSDYGIASQQLNDWSDNWWGANANLPLPSCMDPTIAANSIPAISTSSSTTGCPSGQHQVTGYTRAVLPALSGSPQVLPASVREAAAPTFGPVDTYSGALTYTVDDMDVQDAGKVIAASRTYRSDRLGGGDAGTGWTTAFGETLSSPVGGTATLSLPDGSSVPFSTDPAAGYTQAPGVSASYSTNSGGSTITSPNQVSYQFDPSGELTGMSLGDPGHQLSIDHSGGQVSKVTGVSGRYLSYSRSNGQVNTITDQTGRQVSLSYASGQLTSVTGVDGNAESYAYDSAGRLTQVTAPDGLVKLSAGYNSDGRVAWIQQAGGGRTTFGYDDADGKRTVTLADGTVITQFYDWAGRLVSESLGSTGSHVVYDAEGRVVASITGVPSVAMTSYGPPANVIMYNGQGDPFMSVDPMGNATAATFNAQHEPLVTTRPDGTTVSRTYDSNGRLTSVVDPRGKTWTYTYNSFGQVTSQTDPLSRTRSISYAGNGDATSLTDESNASTLFGYNARGLRNSVTDPLGKETDTTYTTWDAVSSVTSPRNGQTLYAFDTDRRQLSVTNPLGKITSYFYGTEGRLNTTTDALQGHWIISYDQLGRPVQTTDPRNSLYKRTYTPEGWVATSTDPDTNVTSYTYDPSGRPIRVTDPTGAITQTVYDRNGRVIEVDKPDGSVQTWTYNNMGRLSQYTLPRGGIQKTTYDASGNILSVLGPRTVPNTNTLVGVTATYDDAGRLASRADAMGTTTSYAYNDTTRTVTATDPLGTVSSVTYDADGRVSSQTDGAGGTTLYGYDADGNLNSVTDPTNIVTQYSYNLGHQLKSQTDPGGTTTYDYDDVGHLTTVTYPKGDTQTYLYDGVGNVTDYGDRNGNHWGYLYDPAGNLTKATDPLTKDTNYTFDADNRQTSVTDASGVVTNTAYDPVGRPAVTWDVTGASWVTAYDADGNVSTVTDPAGVAKSYGYDKADQVVSAKWVGVAGSFSYAYDLDGRLSQKSDPYATSYNYDVRGNVTKVTDALSNATNYTYDGAGRLLSTTLPSGHQTSATYDAAGRILTANDGVPGDSTSYDYDTDGRLSTVTLPRGGQYHYTYDDDGRLHTQKDPLQAVTTYDFNGMGQPTSIGYPSGNTVAAQYDHADRQTSVTDGTIARSFGYDNAGRLTSATVTGQAGNPPALSWLYDNRGLMQSSTDGLGTTTYGYDSAHRLTSRAPPAGTATTIGYDSRGFPSTIGGPLSISLAFNNAGQITSEIGAGDNPSFTYNSNGQLTGVDGSTATYNSDHQVATLTQSPPGNAADNTTTFGYDNAGRLASAVLARNGTTVSTTTYSYDPDSNRNKITTTGHPDVTTSYNFADQATSDSTGASYGYNPDGNLTSITGPSGNSTFSYDAFGDLTGATTPAGSVTNTPDALGRVASRTSGSTTQAFSYDGTSGALAAQHSGSTTTNLVRDPGGMLLAEATVGGSALRVNPTIHGDIGRLVSSGTTVYTAVYDPYGVASTTGTAPVSLGFQSMYSDPVSGLVNMGARSYDPALGTFTSIDSVIGNLASPTTMNRYQYGAGDPVDAFDPDGHWSWSGLWSDVTSWASQLWDTTTSWVNQQWDNVTNAASQVLSDAAQVVRSVGQDLSTAYHAISQVTKSISPTIKATIASFVVGGVVFLGCEAVTAGAGSVGCATISGAAGGAVYGAMMCPPTASTAHCAINGAIAGGAAGLTAGLGAGLGLGAFGASALGGGIGDATNQLLSTGHINPTEVALSALTAGVTGWAGNKIASWASNKFFNRIGTTPTSDAPATDTAPADTTATPRGSTADASPGAENTAPEAHPLASANCGGLSFSASTRVRTASGKAVAISKLRMGDKVIATDMRTGRTGTAKVSAVMVHYDTNLFSVKVRAGGKTSVISTTWNHPFWDFTQHKWLKAGALRYGDHLRTPSGGYATALGGWTPRRHDGWMWDLTVPGSHDFYVQAAAVAVLVHNCAASNLVYRVIRTDENPANGLYPKDPNANLSVDMHVRFGAQPDFVSQYISTSRDLVSSEAWAARTGNRLVAIDLNQVNGDIIDLSTYEDRLYYLLDWKGRGYAMKSTEVLIQGNVPPEAIVWTRNP